MSEILSDSLLVTVEIGWVFYAKEFPKSFGIRQVCERIEEGRENVLKWDCADGVSKFSPVARRGRTPWPPPPATDTRARADLMVR